MKTIALLAAAFVCWGTVAFATTPSYLTEYEIDYILQDMGTLDGNSSVAYSINNNMISVGDAATSSGLNQAFQFTNYQITTLNGSNTAVSKARAVNDAGHVVGAMQDSNGNMKAYYYDGLETTSLGTLGGSSSYAESVNNMGMVAGHSATQDGDTHAFVDSQYSSMKDIGTLGGNMSVAKDISDAGGVTGYSETEDGQIRAFLYASGFGMTDIGTLGGRDSYGYGVNSQGQVVGFSDNDTGQIHAFLYEDGEMQDIGSLGGEDSFAYSINELGFVVGNAETSDGEAHAFVYHEQAFWYSDATMIDLNDFIPLESDWECLTTAYDINEWGQIVGIGQKDGETHAFIMTPTDVADSSTLSLLMSGAEMATLEVVPIPGSLLLLGSCILAGALRKRQLLS